MKKIIILASCLVSCSLWVEDILKTAPLCPDGKKICLESIEPNIGVPQGNQEITLKGAGFGDNIEEIKVKFGKKEAEIKELTPTKIVAELPSVNQGCQKVDVTISRNSLETSLKEAFFYTVDLEPITLDLPQSVNLGPHLTRVRTPNTECIAMIHRERLIPLYNLEQTGEKWQLSPCQGYGGLPIDPLKKSEEAEKIVDIESAPLLQSKLDDIILINGEGDRVWFFKNMEDWFKDEGKDISGIIVPAFGPGFLITTIPLYPENIRIVASIIIHDKKNPDKLFLSILKPFSNESTHKLPPGKPWKMVSGKFIDKEKETIAILGEFEVEEKKEIYNLLLLVQENENRPHFVQYFLEGIPKKREITTLIFLSGDINNDGLDDFIIGINDRLKIYFTLEVEISGNRMITQEKVYDEGIEVGFEQGILSFEVGDIDNDGVDEVLGYGKGIINMWKWNEKQERIQKLALVSDLEEQTDGLLTDGLLIDFDGNKYLDYVGIAAGDSGRTRDFTLSGFRNLCR